MNINTKILFSILFFTSTYSFSQYQDCDDALAGCNNSIPFTATTNGPGNVLELDGNDISNPGTNPNAAPGNDGCLLFGEENPTWIKISVVSDGQLEFSIGDNAGFDFYDWALWLDNGGDGCNGIVNNTNAPVACNWNGSADSFTGMSDPANLPAGASQDNFENALDVLAGQQFILCFSNFGGQPIDPTLDFSGSAEVSCTPEPILEQTICLGQTATINVPQVNGAGVDLNINSYSWSPTTNISNANGGPMVDVTPTVSTTYIVTLTSPDSVWTEEAVVNVVNLVQPDAGLDDTICHSTSIGYELLGIKEDPNNTSLWEFEGPTGTPGPSNAIFQPNSADLTPITKVNYPGLYQYVLHEIDANGVCPDGTDTVNIFFAKETHTVDVTDPLCFGDDNGIIKITSTGNLPVQDYSYDGGTTYVLSDEISSATAGNNSDATYTVISRNIFGCEAQTIVTITNPTPVSITVGPNPDTLICENGSAALYANAQNGTSFTYNWDFTTDENAIQLVNPTMNTTYSVSATNEFGCESATVSTNVNLRTPIALTIMPNDTICPNGESTLTIEAIGGDSNFSYDWTANGTAFGSSTNITTVSVDENTTYCVNVTDGCESTLQSICTDVIMREVPNPIFATDTTEGCNETDIRFYNLTNYNLAETTTDSVIWNIEGNIYNDIDTAVHSFLNVGVFDVSLQVFTQYGCTNLVDSSQVIEIHDRPDANFYVLPNPTTIFNTEVEMINNTDGDNNMYQWYFTSGLPSTSNQDAPSILFPEGVAGDYPVKLIVINEYNCVDSTEDIVHVVSDVIIYAPNAFTPDGDQLNNTWRVYIDGIDTEDFHLVMFNRWGEIVWESYNAESEWNGRYGSNDIIDGTYVWKVITKDVSTDKRYEFRGTVNIFH